ncbi:MAG TPA: bifunctional phosphopantothenoylcysteine decarboxylase/phosphopantothenate--cysteine ligase CoaBC [Rhodanobacteraceae bacterium]|nr:bifunctional phosphopantothenoylcysteine decarboxylase/phosphopantothenate--cysteine ligase CoaBC [Rhodanobacteraceae bacterium]
MSLAQRRILLGVSGGIAAYKACELTRLLRQAGAELRVVLSRNAEHFVTAASLQALSGQPVRNSLWDPAAEAAMGHIELARWAERIVVAPASADLLARLAHGMADDLLSTVCLASAAPLLLAPAMNQQMWAHPATQANVRRLREHGATLLGPAAGEQACGDVGPGRMLEPAALRDALVASFAAGTMAGLRVLISAGPTLEDIDPVRYIGNRSSGRMGFAVAEAAATAGAEVTLVAGPVTLPTPAGVAHRIDVRSASQMHAAMLDAAAATDIVIAAAAVADFRPRQMAPQKLKKTAASPVPHFDLVQNPDIVADLARLEPRPFLVGFAAETEQIEAHARGKLARKGLDMIAANRVGDGLGFDCDDNALTVLWAGGEQRLPQAPKRELARQLLDLVLARYHASEHSRSHA